MSTLVGLNILVVDDSKEVRESLKSILAEEGANVQTAMDGFDAISKAKASNFNLILMDLRMPGLDGKDAALTIVKLPYPKKIIALTGDLSCEMSGEIHALFDDLIFKPVNPRDLFTRLSEAILPGRMNLA